MAIRQWIDVDRKLICIEVEGAFTIEDIIRTISDSVNDPDYQKGFNVLTDHRKVESHISVRQAKSMAHYLTSMSDYMAGIRWAAISASPVTFGMLRMLAVYLEQVPIQVAVFENETDAFEWLADGD